ncbi:MAG: hypothetical protein LBH40_05270 [Alphaproteobacteria bacterium]|jgi:membrane-anchored protein YejM (alkaline phosphatase superfamily)|nr:hypothetical protein [Alphaproteobacteria bacterium]
MNAKPNPYRKSFNTSNNTSDIENNNSSVSEELDTDNENIKELIDSLKKTKPNSKTYSFYLETNLVEKIEKLSKETKTSTSSILNKILHRFFDK